MEYVIHTLEIEIARLRMALRKFYEANISYVDTQDGYPPDFEGMRRHISELERAIEMFREWEENAGD